MKISSLEETLIDLNRQHAVLLSDATVWPSTVSRRLKQGVNAHREELLEMLAASDYRVCPASWYHWRTWTHEGQCETCARLAPEIEKIDQARETIDNVNSFPRSQRETKMRRSLIAV